ncbi:MAG: ABC transporter ATP-binding protein [Chloroflexota bacterium]|nr:ABC transporter ATP-binding protein [Chloroflexota bacterium]
MIKSMRRMFGLTKRFRGRLVVSQLLLFISALTTVGFATLVQGMVNQGMKAGDPEAVLSIGFWMFVLAMIGGLCMAGAAALAVFFSQGISYVIRSMLYEKLQTFSFGNYDRFSTGELMVRLNADAVNVQNGMLYALMLGLYAPFILLITLVLVIITTPSLIWLLLAIIAIIVVLMFLLIPAIFRNFEQRQKRLDAVNNTLQENITGIQVVKAFVREDYEIERFNGRADKMRQPAYGAAWRVAFLSPLLTGVGQLAIITALVIGGYQVLEAAELNVGQVIAFTQYLSLTISPLAMMAIVIPMVLRGDTSAQRILEVYDDVADIQDKEGIEPLDMEKVKGRIAFENVSFAFRRPDGELDPPALKNINLVIEPGKQVGFLGATGAGKSALVNLIPRFYDVTEGRITIDGVDVRDIPQENLRQIVGIALQEAVLFKGDVRFNMKFGQPDAEDDVMFEAAKAADSWGFINNLPEKWQAAVARRGYNFSGGQRQRLSINRALTPEPRILILDDSTSALDASTEGRVQAAIPGFTNGSTTLYVAQRISAVIELDNIVLLENGEIVAMGNHEELLASNSLYQEIYESQLGGDVTAGIDLEVQK